MASAVVPPSVPDLSAESDTGNSNSDNLTNDSTPTLTGSGPANTLIRIYEGDVLVAEGMSDGSGAWSIILPAQSDGLHHYRALAVDGTGVESEPVQGLQAAGAEFRVNTTTLGSQFYPSLGSLLDGGFVATWSSDGQDGSGYGVFAQRYDAAGAAVGGEFRVNTTTVSDQDSSVVVGLDDGGFVVVWQAFDEGRQTYWTYAQRYDAAGAAAGAEIRANTFTGYAQLPYVAALAGGGFVVAWEANDGDLGGIYAQRYDSAGAPVGAEFLINTHTGDSQDGVDITGLSNGGFVAVWQSYDQDGNGYGVFAQRYDATGVAVGPETQVNQNWGASQHAPSVAALADGGYIVVWQSGEIYARRYDADGAPVGPEFQIADYAADDAITPVVVGLPDGGFAVAWVSEGQDGSGYGVHARQYDRWGVPVAPEYQVNSHVSGDQGRPSIAASGDGLLITWMSDGQDGSGWGVFGQRYDFVDAGLDVVIDTTPPLRPTITLDPISDTGTPGDGVTRKRNPTFLGTAEAGQEVTILLNGSAIDSTTADESGTWSWTAPSLPNGVHDFVARVIDGAGNAAEASRTVTIEETAPSLPTLEAESDTGASATDRLTNDVTPTLTGTGPASTIIRIYEGASLVAQGTSDGAGRWSITLPPQSPGGHSYRAVSVNEHGVESLAATMPLTAQGANFLVSAGGWETSDARVEVLADGGFVIIWRQEDSTGDSDIYGRRYDASGTAAGAEFRVNAYVAGDQAQPDVTALADGGFLVVWMSPRDPTGVQYLSERGIYAQRYNAAGAAVGGEFRVSSHPDDWQDRPAITTLNDGSFVVVWNSTYQNGIHGQRYAADGSAIGGEFRLNADGWPSNPQITPLEDGGFLVAWNVYRDSPQGYNYDVIARRFDANGAAVSAQFQVNVSTVANQTVGAVQGLPDGGFLVAWTSWLQDESGSWNYDVFARRYDSHGSPLGTEFRVNSVGAYDQTNPRITLLGDGGYVIGWTDSFGNRGQRYDANGVAVDDPFPLHADSLATLPDGLITVGAGSGVYARRYGLEPNVLDITIDLTAPDQPSAPALDPASDTGLDDSDGLTGDSTPTLIGTGPADTLIRIYEGETLVGEAFSDEAGAWAVTLGDQPDGLHAYSARAVDAAGNESALLRSAPVREGGETRVNTYTANDQQNQLVVALAGGGVAITWLSSGQDGSGSGVYTQVYDAAGAAVGGETRVNTYSSGAQTDQKMIALAGGGYVVLWESGGDGSLTGVYAQMFSASGVKVGGEFRVNSYTANHQFDAAIAALTNGGFVVTWTSFGQDGSSWGVYGQRYDSSGAVAGGEFRVNTYTSGDQGPSQVTPLETGGFVATWSSYGQDGSDSGLYAQVYNVAGAPVGAEFRVNAHTAGRQSAHETTALEGGGFVVTWESDGQDGSDTGVYARVFSASGAAVSGEFRVNTHTGGPQVGQAVAALDTGGFVITWTSWGDQDGSEAGVYAQRYDASGAAVGSEFHVSTHTAGSQYGPSIEGLPGGGFLITWTSYGQDGSGDGVYGQVFDGSGAAVGGEFAISTHTSGDQYRPSVVAFPDGRFVAAWLSANQDGSGTGIYLQRFEQPVVELEIRIDATAPEATGGSSPTLTEGGAAALQGYLVYADALGGEVTFTLVAAMNGAVTFDGTALVAGAVFTQSDIDAGRVSFRHDGSETLTGGFTFRAADERGRISTVQTFTALITPVDDPTIARNDAVATAESDVYSGSVFADNGAGPDTDPDTSLTVTEVNGHAAHVGTPVLLASGALLLLRADGTFEYDPNGVFDALTDIETGGSNVQGTDTFSYTLAGGATATVTVTVHGRYGGGDLVLGTAGNDHLIGGWGDDRLVGGLGADSLEGGAGLDTADYSASTAAVVVDLALGIATGGHASGDILASIEGVIGSAHDDMLRGASSDDHLSGGGGDDRLEGGVGDDLLAGAAGRDLLNGGGGTDLLEGGSGDDALNGGTGDDTLLGGQDADALSGGEGNDLLDGGSGADLLQGGLGDDRLIGDAGADLLSGGEGVDEASYERSNAAVIIDLATESASGGHALGDVLSSIENLLGSSFNDTLTGDSGANVLDGGSGDDLLIGGLGADTLIGGLGIDTASYRDATSKVKVWLNLGVGGAWASGDTLTGIENLIGSTYDDLLVGDDLNNVLQGSGGADEVKGGLGDDQLVGASGDDILDGGDGHDTLIGGDNRDTLKGGDGDDSLNGGTGNDKLNAGSGADNLQGGSGDDKLAGGSDNDVIEGGTGDDRLTGGSGDDLFVFRGASGADVITDFKAGAGLRDVISFTTSLFTSLTDVKAHTANDGLGNCVISKNGVVITLMGVTRGDLVADDFVFVASAPDIDGKDVSDPLTLPPLDEMDPLILPTGLETKATPDDLPLILPGDDGLPLTRSEVDLAELGLSDFGGRDPHRFLMQPGSLDWIV